MLTIHSLLASTEGGLDQPANTDNRILSRYKGDGRLMSSSDFIILNSQEPGSPELIAVPSHRPPALV